MGGATAFLVRVCSPISWAATCPFAIESSHREKSCLRILFRFVYQRVFPLLIDIIDLLCFDNITRLPIKRQIKEAQGLSSSAKAILIDAGRPNAGIHGA